jgi:hypothetical protein
VDMPSDSGVYEVMVGGTWEMLMGLFDQGLVSPFSIDPSGWTLLHVSGPILNCLIAKLLTNYLP